MGMFYYRPQTKFAKVIFLHLSVGHSVHRGCLHPGGVCIQGGWADPRNQTLRDTVNERWVRILLECILVNKLRSYIVHYVYVRECATL